MDVGEEFEMRERERDGGFWVCGVVEKEGEEWQ